jgi:hypothetical protein
LALRSLEPEGSNYRNGDGWRFPFRTGNHGNGNHRSPGNANHRNPRDANRFAPPGIANLFATPATTATIKLLSPSGQARSREQARFFSGTLLAEDSRKPIKGPPK